MQYPPKRRCENCRYWQVFDDRVTAKLSFGPAPSSARGHELRRCRYAPPPHVDAYGSRWTDENYTCSGWEIAKEK